VKSLTPEEFAYLSGAVPGRPIDQVREWYPGEKERADGLVARGLLREIYFAPAPEWPHGAIRHEWTPLGKLALDCYRANDLSLTK